MSIKLGKSEITKILRNIAITDHADPFGELAYLLEFVEARVIDALPDGVRATDDELRETAEKLLELSALRVSYNLLEAEVQTGWIRNSTEVIGRILSEKTRELTSGTEYQLDVTLKQLLSEV